MLRIAAELAGKCLQWVISRNTQSEDKFSALGRIASVTLAVAKTPRASHFDGSWMGRARPLCPDISDVNFLWNLDGIVNLDTKIAHGAVDLRCPSTIVFSAHNLTVRGSNSRDSNVVEALGDFTEIALAPA